MTSPDRDPTALALALFLMASAAVAIAAAGSAAERFAAGPHAGPGPAAVALLEPAWEPIRAEAQVFRTTPGMMALQPTGHRERSAHPRRLATVRFLRAFPGAPPRIPHPLTADEFRTDACRTCHERGGYSVRFAAYVPLTPHPERGICLQCHVGVDSIIGAQAPDPNPNTRCAHCHGPNGGAPRQNATLTWATTVWPTLPQTIPGRDPPAIPHDLQFRENCLTCHAGPAAVEEIRTRHPERANCRQCHLAPDPAAQPFTRPAQEQSTGAGEAP